MKFEITPVAFVESCYKEKFATPRQSGLVPLAKGTIKFVAPFNHADAVLGLDNCSHIWLEFIFHKCIEQGWKNKVRPPRLGGNEKMGVFATRATHRPNGLGLSVVKLDSVNIIQEAGHDTVTLSVSGLDLIDGTPIIDVKPYVPYSDIIQSAQYPFAQTAPDTLAVTFTEQALLELKQQNENKAFIEQVLSLDPRPAFHQVDSTRVYGAKLNTSNVTWKYFVKDNKIEIEVISIEPL
jgi:tRNA-Thr(GGU) m(6)t(6)A37 methyltransferase TsaA